jgi:5-methylcytosine-specific restriction protein B
MTDLASRETLSSALASWDREAVRSRAAEAEALREQFVARFPRESWADMPLESYALGQEIEGTVCWWLEFGTELVGSMRGGTARKHLIFFGGAGATWNYPNKYNSVEDAWHAIRAGFVEALDLASKGRPEEVDDIDALQGGAALRTKTLYMYFPDQVLPVCSGEHLAYFLRALGQPAADSSTVRRNRQLLALLRAEPLLTGLTTQELGRFLYHWADPRPSVRVVKIAPGDLADQWSDCLVGQFICIGWDEVGDLSEYATKEAFREAFRECYPYNGNEAQVSRKSNELWTLMTLEPGDKVITNRGISEVLAIGTVNDTGYAWRPERAKYRHTLGVDWDTSFAQSIEPVKAWATTTVSKVSAALYKTISGAEGPPKPVETDRLYSEIEEALARRGQVILYGPPGTGKTYAARRAAVWLLSGGSGDPQASAVLGDSTRVADVERQFSAGRAQSRQVWFMVANPSLWSWSRLRLDGTVDYSLGRLKRNYPNVRAGDLVVGYESTPTQRVVALARITTEYDQDAPAESALVLEHVSDVENGLTWNELQADPILAESEPLRFRCQGTLFGLSAIEADRLLGLLLERDPRIGTIAEPSIRQLTRITFHPSYTYEDFVEGFRPRASSTGALDLVLSDGVFKEVCAAASADPDRRYVVLIDEINRGNIPKIFGELITLLEKDKRGLTVRLAQSGQEFSVPPNVWIIGTMNTADRSIHLLDTALRRRFAFAELLPDSQTLVGATAGALALDVFLDSLNELVTARVGREKQVGHAIFLEDGLPIDTPEAFAAVFRHDLLPLLQEYLYEDYAELEGLLGSDVIDASAQQPAELVDDPEALCGALAHQFGAYAST